MEATDYLIVRALIEVLKVKPFEKITIDDIARQADVDRSTFYRYFHNKYEALSASMPVIITPDMFHSLDQMHPSAQLTSIVNWMVENRKLMKNLLIENQQFSSYQELVRVVTRILNQFNRDLPESHKNSPLVRLILEAPEPNRLIRLAATMLVSILTDYISHDASLQPEDVMADIRYLFQRLGLEEATQNV